jgi:hypothetical protein
MLKATSETGMEFRDLLSDPAFLNRTGKKRDFQQPFDALRRVTQVFATRPEDVLQELVDIAMTCCGADSAGISYVAIIIRQHELDEKARQAAKAEASAERAHKMAHQINNSLQSLTNTMFLASQGGPGTEAYMKMALTELAALSDRVRRLLALKYPED